MLTEEIAQHLKQGKTMEDLLALGYKKGTIYSVQRKLRQEGALPVAHKGNGQRPPSGTAQAEAYPEVDNDPEILQLKKELRKAQLERQLRELKAPLELEAKLKTLWNASVRAGREKQQKCPFYKDALCTAQRWKQKEQVPEVMGTPVSKDSYWYVKPSALHCALCTVHLHFLVAALEEDDIMAKLRQTFRCDNCGSSAQQRYPSSALLAAMKGPMATGPPATNRHHLIV